MSHVRARGVGTHCVVIQEHTPLERMRGVHRTEEIVTEVVHGTASVLDLALWYHGTWTMSFTVCSVSQFLFPLHSHMDIKYSGSQWGLKLNY